MNKSHKQLSYQTNAVNACIEHLQNNKEFRLQSPTGSGKTFIISQIIDKYLEDETLNSYPTSFLFVAPSIGSLDYQGYEKIYSYLARDWAKGYSCEYIGTSKNKSTSVSKSYLQNIDYLKPNTCYFIGWQMFKKGTRITEIDSEKNDIYKVISNTKERNIKVVLIIDEAHRELTSTKDDINTKNTILDSLDPYKEIRVSATLEQVKEEVDYKITYDDVREEAAIKENVIISEINSNLKNIDQYDEEEQLILSAIEKQKEIKEAYFKNKININPLILIQIPDNVVIDKDIKTEEHLLNKINNILEKHNYEKGYNYAIWLDKLKTNKNKQEISNNNSKIEILIFKTAIATGWDIPRANILVRIREAKTKAFNIQTLGRILRNPFFKYYQNELIDNAFVFTKDDKYKEYIKQENIVSEQSEFITIKRSKASINSTFSINKILIDDSKYEEKELIDYINEKILKDEKFIKFFEYEEEYTRRGSAKISTRDYLDSDIVQKNINRRNDSSYSQTSFIFDKPKINLFDLYIKYKTATKSSILINKILDKLALSVHKLNKKIKDFYWACYHNWNKQLWSFDGNNTTLKDWIEKIKNEYLSNKINFKYKEYVLPSEYKVSTKKYNKDYWDKINTFDASLNIKNLSSGNEKEFYKMLKNKDLEGAHIFRNGESPNQDYYVEYLDKENKKRKFFPDFILINEKDKICLILESKGGNNSNDIDKNTKEKIKSLSDALKRGKMKQKYDPKKVIKVSWNESKDEVVYNDDNEDIIEWNDIKKILKI